MQRCAALVSSAETLQESMLVRHACIGNLVLETALDTCATNCFVSKSFSKLLTAQGYASYEGPVRYDVQQGNPLCSTREVHMVPVKLVNVQGQMITWNMCMFIVADCGAQAIIGYPTLQAGGIIAYTPPEDYKQLLATACNEAPSGEEYQKEAKEAVKNSRRHQYGPPTNIVNCLTTEVQLLELQPAGESETAEAAREQEERNHAWNQHWVPDHIRTQRGLHRESRMLREREALNISTDGSLSGTGMNVVYRDADGRPSFGYPARLPFGIVDSPGEISRRNRLEHERILRERLPEGMDLGFYVRASDSVPSEGDNACDDFAVLSPRLRNQEEREAAAKARRLTAVALLTPTTSSAQAATELHEQGCKPPPKPPNRDDQDAPSGARGAMAAASPEHAQPSPQAASSAPQEHQKNETETEPKKQNRGPETEREKKTQKASESENLLSSVKKKKGATEALTDVSPYGLNPPLADEVLEALQILKQLSENAPETLWTQEQLQEIQTKLSKNRPEWSKCLTMQHISTQFDSETVAIIEALMDSARYQKSIFGKSLKLPAKVNQFEINSKPGVDEWTPQKARRFKNPLMYTVVDLFLDWQIADELIHPSNALRPAVLTVVEKEKRDPRCCFDYRLRNERTEVPVFPMPDVQEHLDDAMGYEYYCSFDMAKMFNQIEIKKEHRDLAAFITHRGVFTPDRIQFGLAGGPQHAVREVGGLMERSPLTNGKAFTEWAKEQNAAGYQPPYKIETSGIVKGSNLVPFIDDVFLKSNTKDAIVKLVELFFQFCEEHHLLLSRKKANICKTYLKMLGMVVSKSGKHLDPSRIISLLEAAKPMSKVTMQSLLCSYNFVRMFVPNFSQMVAPLYESTKGIIWKGKGSDKSRGIDQVDPEFVWTDEMTRAYEQLRGALLEAPILMCPDWTLPLFLSVDASLRGEGWVLWQLIPTKNAGEKVAVAILYGSRKYTGTEAAWETTRQEATAIRDALLDVDEYVFGQEFYLFTDHLNLRWMHNSVNRAVIRMRNFLSQYRMRIVHCPGIWNNADSISRLENNTETTAIAADLNIATEASMKEGEGLKFSCGTCTEEDEPNHGIIKRTYPYKDSHGKTATAMQTRTSGQCSLERCILCTTSKCSVPSLCSDSDSSESETNNDEAHQQAHCQHTAQSTQHLQPTEDYAQEEWNPIFEQLRLAQGSALSNADMRRAATVWNTSAASNTLIRPCITDEPLSEDQSDKEDYEWCGNMHRTALVLRTPAVRRTSRKKETRDSSGNATMLQVKEEEDRMSDPDSEEPPPGKPLCAPARTWSCAPTRSQTKAAAEQTAREKYCKDDEEFCKLLGWELMDSSDPLYTVAAYNRPRMREWVDKLSETFRLPTRFVERVIRENSETTSIDELESLVLQDFAKHNKKEISEARKELLARVPHSAIPAARPNTPPGRVVRLPKSTKKIVNFVLPEETEAETKQNSKTNHPSLDLLPGSDTAAKDFLAEMTQQTLKELDAAIIQQQDLGPVEVHERTTSTQTTPADFRAMRVRIPDNGDFKAIHGGINGHHGLDYSYKKLLRHCGSQFANERGEATRVKEALKQYIEACPVCQKVKVMREKVKSKHSFIISRPFLEMSYDIVVFSEPDKHGNRYLIVAIDNFTKLVELKAVEHRDAETIARFLLEIAGRYGNIARLRSDRDPAFTGQIVSQLNAVRGTETVMCIPYHPEANSICERQNAIIVEHIKCMCVGNALGPHTRLGWSDVIPIVFSIVNNTPKNPLGISPLAMVYGVFANYERPLLPVRAPPGNDTNPVDYVRALIEFQNKLLNIAEDLYSEHINKFVRKYDKQIRATKGKGGELIKPKELQEGDFVLVNRDAKGGNSKLTPWCGPRLVLERRDNDPGHPVVDLLELTDMTTSQVSIDDCRLFNTGWFEESTMMQELIKLSAGDKEEFVVETIVDYCPRMTGSKRTKPLNQHMFRVKWAGFPDSENTWEPWSALKELEPYAQYAYDNPQLNLMPQKSAAKSKGKTP